MFCENCGTKLTEGSRFCGECGTKIISEEIENSSSSQQDNTMTIEEQAASVESEVVNSNDTSATISPSIGAAVAPPPPPTPPIPPTPPVNSGYNSLPQQVNDGYTSQQPAQTNNVIAAPGQSPQAVNQQPYVNSAQDYTPTVQMDTNPLTVGQFMGILFLQAIPILNIILWFKWAFGSDVNPNKKSYGRAILIMLLICIILWFVVGASLTSAILRMAQSFSY